MVFNVHFGLRDDHAKNHAFLRKPQEEWTLSPAYDVVFSRPGAGNGLHRQMPVMGRRQGLSVADLREMGRRHGLKPAFMTSTLDQIAEAAAAWENIALSLGIDEIRLREIRDAWEPVIVKT
jgi:serine/threonine-protein kinase HipA